ncbi:MAG: AMP-binding protein [Proteobacteria bacterium]|nr:AMP-binding protein [Pseudomonadota bacterium]
MELFSRLVLRLVYFLFDSILRVRVVGLENVPPANESILIVANHQSFLDAPLLTRYLPGTLTFPINTFIARQKWIQTAMRIGGNKTFPLDPANPLAIRALIKHLEANPDTRTVIFPEGRITLTGRLMKVYEGAGLIADKTGAKILPVRIDGAEFSKLSRLGGVVPRTWLPRITITILPPETLDVDKKLKGRARRQVIGKQMSQLMVDTEFKTRKLDRTLFEAMLDTTRHFGMNYPLVTDIERKPLTYRKLCIGSHVLGEKLAHYVPEGKYVGLMLPNSVGAVVTFFALQYINRVPAMINFSAGAQAILAGCEAAEITTIFTSRRFVELGKLGGLVDQLRQKVTIVYLEEVRQDISGFDKIAGLLRSYIMRQTYKSKAGANDPAAVLFTSGSEGVPKGVVLSHKNLLANCYQAAATVDFNPADKMLNAMPMFHAFGLIPGTILPVVMGVPVFMYPSPLHFRIVPELAYDIGATLMFGTDTFLSRYGRYAHPYDMFRMRHVFAGAEKLKPETRQLWADKFGVRILEGYGATEASPVVAVNSPMACRHGTVGRLMPGMEYYLETVKGVSDGKRLFIKGPNVMLGYLKTDKPGVIQPPVSKKGEGWYDTGDIVAIDEDGFVTIKGRAKRFAKIAGEMVSLGAVEDAIQTLWPDNRHAVVTLPDDKRGEKLVLVTDHHKAKRADVMEHAKKTGLAELYVPRDVLCVDKLPLLGSGKPDYPAIQKLVEKKLGS